jgi:hypothetical protein
MAEPGTAREMGRRGRSAVCERFDRRLQGRQIEALFASLLPAGRAAGGAAMPQAAATTLARAAAAPLARRGTS